MEAPPLAGVLRQAWMLRRAEETADKSAMQEPRAPSCLSSAGRTERGCSISPSGSHSGKQMTQRFAPASTRSTSSAVRYPRCLGRQP